TFVPDGQADAAYTDATLAAAGSKIGLLKAIFGKLANGISVALGAGTATIGIVGVAAPHYETVAAGQTDQAMGATGAAGDRLDGILIVPATLSPGAVSIKDGSGTAITIFTGGTNSVGDLTARMVPLGGIVSASGAWKITTGVNVSAIGIGRFT